MSQTARPLGPIAAYRDEMQAIDARLHAIRDEARQSRTPWKPTSNVQARSKPPRDPLRRQHQEAEEERAGCTLRHFGAPDPTTGLGLDTPARLWRWIAHQIQHIKMLKGMGSAYHSMLDEDFTNLYRDALAKAYDSILEMRMRGFDLPEVPPPPYPLLPEAESQAKLCWLASELEAGDKPRPPLWLGNQGDSPKIRGKEVPHLTVVRRKVLEALLETWPDGLTKDQLVVRSGCADAVNTLKAIRKLSPEGHR